MEAITKHKKSTAKPKSVFPAVLLFLPNLEAKKHRTLFCHKGNKRWREISSLLDIPGQFWIDVCNLEIIPKRSYPYVMLGGTCALHSCDSNNLSQCFLKRLAGAKYTSC